MPKTGMIFGGLNKVIHRLAPWLRLASEFALASVIARGIAALTGLLLVRALPKNEYAVLTLLLTSMTFVSTFSDMGATESLAYFRWRWEDRPRAWLSFVPVVLRFRRVTFLAGATLAGAYVATTVPALDGSPTIVLAGCGVSFIAAWLAITAAVRTYALKLAERFRSAYVVELSHEATKIALILALWIGSALDAFTSIVSVAIAAGVSAAVATQLLPDQPARATAESGAGRRRALVVKQVVPVLPSILYFTAQQPLITWMAARLAPDGSVADIGALGRIGTLISLVAGFGTSVVIPKIAAGGDARAFVRRYVGWWLSLVLFGASVLGLVAWVPSIPLMILGSEYANLEGELLLTTATAITSTWAGFAWNVSRARGLVQQQTRGLVVMIIAQISSLLYFDLTTTAGLLSVTLCVVAAGLLFQLALHTVSFLRTVPARSA